MIWLKYKITLFDLLEKKRSPKQVQSDMFYAKVLCTNFEEKHNNI